MAMVTWGKILGASFANGCDVGWVAGREAGPAVRPAGRVVASGTVACATNSVPPSPCVLGLTTTAAPSSARNASSRRANALRRAAAAGELSFGFGRVVAGAVVVA